MEQFDPYALIDNQSLAVVNGKGELRTVYCPFRVLCIQDQRHVASGCWYYVQAVTAKSNLINYHIGGHVFNHSLFQIYISF